MLKIERNASLKSYTTFGIDVKAAHLTFVHNKDEILELIQSDIFKSSPQRLILGGGSNLLLTQDFDGLVIVNKIMGKHLISEERGATMLFSVASGENWNNLVLRSVDRNYVGIENLVAIPGTVGGAPVQNIGAYGVEVSSVIVRVCGVDLITGEYKQYNNDECEFGYRTSTFKTTLKEDFFITDVIIRLSKSTRNNYQPTITYKGVPEQLEVMGHHNRADPQWIHSNARILADAITTIRNSKLPNRKEIGTAGSFFGNPIVDSKLYEELKKDYPDLIGYPSKIEGAMKLSAGQLIELCGLKGYRDGDAGIYDKHALILVNYGKASGEDMKKLVTMIQDKVKEKFGIDIFPEVNIL